MTMKSACMAQMVLVRQGDRNVLRWSGSIGIQGLGRVGFFCDDVTKLMHKRSGMAKEGCYS